MQEQRPEMSLQCLTWEPGPKVKLTTEVSGGFRAPVTCFHKSQQWSGGWRVHARSIGISSCALRTHALPVPRHWTQKPFSSLWSETRLLHLWKFMRNFNFCTKIRSHLKLALHSGGWGRRFTVSSRTFQGHRVKPCLNYPPTQTTFNFSFGNSFLVCLITKRGGKVGARGCQPWNIWLFIANYLYKVVM